MKRNFLTRLRINGTYYLGGALLLLIGVPLYQLLVLLPQGYGDALAKSSFPPYLLWISSHQGQFWGYRALLIIAFACLLSLPFTLFRIIVAQEILEDGHEEEDTETQAKPEIEHIGTHTSGAVPDGMPAE